MDDTVIGVLIGVVATFVGGVLLNFAVKFYQKRAKLEWFSVSDISIPESFGYFKEIKDLIEASFDNNSLTAEARSILRDGMRDARRVFVLSLDNEGNLPARKVQIMFRDSPSGFAVNPKVSVSKQISADGSVFFEVDSVAPHTTVSLTFYGVSKYEIQAVFFDGHSLREKYAPKIGPYFPDRKYTIFAVIFAILAGSMFQSGLQRVVDYTDGAEEIGPQSE